MPEENHRAIYTKRIIVIAPQFKTNFQKSVDMVSPAQRYKYHFKISERKNYCTRNKQHSIRLCQLFHHCVIPYLMFIKWKIIWETISIFAYHCVKRVRIRSYSGPHFSRNFPHSDWIRRDTEYLSVFSPNAGNCEKNADQNNSEYAHILRSDD